MICGMRRVLVPVLSPGPLILPDAAAHHLRDVLRAEIGDVVEAFTAAGERAVATITQLRPNATVQIGTVSQSPAGARLFVASAVPKGDRADSMIEKLCEIGVTAFMPLRTARSVVHPEGAGKLGRWERIAAEAARQSGRDGVMAIEPLTTVHAAVEHFLNSSAPEGSAEGSDGVFLSTGDATPLIDVTPAPTLLLIGPEGGWTEDEEAEMRERGLTAASLGPTILRIETAAVVAAGVAKLLQSRTPID